MRYLIEEYNPEKHDLYKALVVDQPSASALFRSFCVKDGIKYAEISALPKGRKTTYRGDILIIAGAKSISGLEKDCFLGFVELYDCKPIGEVTKEELKFAGYPENIKFRKNLGWVWFFRNLRRVVELPIVGCRGFFDLVYSKGYIVKYPDIVRV